jgi:hypothetical protein
MEILSDSSEERVELMMYLMHFVKRRKQMKGSMCPIEEEVLNKVDDKDLSKDFPETRKILKP